MFVALRLLFLYLPLFSSLPPPPTLHILPRQTLLVIRRIPRLSSRFSMDH